ncbi:MAG: hypothetical protein ACR2PK_09900 [Acidimicrobiales bacterium]
MPDFLKKASRHTKKICHDDETPLAALFVRPLKGSEAKRLGTPGGALSKVTKFADADDAADDNTSTTDAHEAMFAKNAVLVLTNQRLMAFEHRTYSGRVGALIGDMQLSAVASMALDAPPVGESGPATLKVAFSDGLAVELTPGSRRRRFVEAFEATTQPA